MIELRCSKCGKICAYLAVGSKIANGAVITCHKCRDAEKYSKPDIPDFLGQLFGGRK